MKRKRSPSPQRKPTKKIKRPKTPTPEVSSEEEEEYEDDYYEEESSYVEGTGESSSVESFRSIRKKSDVKRKSKDFSPVPETTPVKKQKRETKKPQDDDISSKLDKMMNFLQ